MESFMPHGYCLTWNPVLVWLFVVGNSLVTLSYYSIPASIGIMVSKKHGLVFHWMFILFGSFIFACGTTHLIKIWTIWHPDYWLEGSMDAFTGVLSLVTAILLWPLVPKVLAFPSPKQYRDEIEQRKKAEEKFRGLVEAAPDALVIVDRLGKIVLVNQRAEETFGYSRDVLLGSTVDTLIPSPSQQHETVGWNNFIAEQIQSGQSLIESTGRRENGTHFPVEISMRPLTTDEGSFISASIRDVTERKTAEQRLKDSEQRFRLMVEAVQDYSIIMLDDVGKVVLWNSGDEKLEGYSADEIMGESFSKFYAKENQESGKPAKDLKQAIDNGRFSEEGWRVRQDGSAFYANVLLTSIKDESGNLRGFANITRDITERTLAEESERELSRQLARSNGELQQFAYVVAHDLREPLRSISTFGQLLPLHA